ncbi:hypothetical protein Sm713_79470 [Streptomyces sp. TS71-3]|nr:hypothetical protein Sm713_79470 [Streptomyces sp. TS71-3]
MYGLTQGFGPLVEHTAATDSGRQAAGLLDHLTSGQGPALPPQVARTMVWLRLHGMALGHSAAAPEVWQALAEQWNAGFTPVVPQDGSLSASGDLVPLAHAAQAAAGRGQAWRRDTDGTWHQEPSADWLRRHGTAPVEWDARSALAFVNGTSACLARALHNHAGLAALASAVAEGTGRLTALLGASPEPYDDRLSAVRRQAGQRRAAALIRAAPDAGGAGQGARRLQEPYSLRCAPQVVGAVLDQLSFQGVCWARRPRAAPTTRSSWTARSCTAATSTPRRSRSPPSSTCSVCTSSPSWRNGNSPWCWIPRTTEGSRRC